MCDKNNMFCLLKNLSESFRFCRTSDARFHFIRQVSHNLNHRNGFIVNCEKELPKMTVSPLSADQLLAVYQQATDKLPKV